MPQTSNEARLDNLKAAQGQLLELLSGMDYCLDWKPEPPDWSTRQVVYHLLESPPGGLQRVLWAAVSGESEPIEVWAGDDNITPERAGYDLDQVLDDVARFFTATQEALEAAGKQEIAGESVLDRYQTSGGGQTYTVGELLDSMFGAHWSEHLGQIRALRDALGM